MFCYQLFECSPDVLIFFIVQPPTRIMLEKIHENFCKKIHETFHTKFQPEYPKKKKTVVTMHA